MQKECLKCGTINKNFVNNKNSECPNCGAIYSKVPAALRRIKKNRLVKINKELETPLISKIFYIIAFLELLDGIILCVEFWPGDPGNDKEWKSITYTPALTWLMAGIIECAMLFSIGVGLKYLRAIYIKAINT